jgi:preprotein translocase subunit YajC
MSSQVRERPRIDLKSIKGPGLPMNLSPVEIVAAVLSLAMFSLAVFYYFSALRPQQDRLRRAQEQLKGQQEILIKGGAASAGKQVSTVDTIKAEKDSLDAFESNWLKSPSQGRIAIIDEINELVKKNNMLLASGIEMHVGSASQADQDKGSSRRKKQEDVLDVFPKAQFVFTVVGQYADLRRFLDEIEHSKQFLVINSLGLTSVEPKFGTRAGKGGAAMGPAMGPGPASGVALSVGMTAYFRP